MPPLANPNTQPAVTPEQQSVPELAGSNNQPEVVAQSAVERAAETPSSSAVQPSTVTAQLPLQSTLQPSVSAPATSAQPNSPAADDSPAADSNGIEKTWVDRADRIIATQQNDPYAEEQQQEDLSAEYLQKRFNLTIKRTNPTGKS